MKTSAQSEADRIAANAQAQIESSARKRCSPS